MGRDEVAKPLDDNDRKMQFSEAMDSTSELQGFSKNSGVILKEINEGSCKTKRVQFPNATTTLPNDSIIKVVNPSFMKYPKHLQIEGALYLKEHLAKSLNWPESVRKKRSSSGLNHLSDTLGNTLVCLGKRQKVAIEKLGTQSAHSLPEEVVEEILSRLPVKSLARFRCVCKSWHRLIYSKRFISLHLKNYTTSQLLVGTSWVFEVSCSMYFLPPPPLTGGYYDNDLASQEMMKPKLLGGSCNGIVCLYDDYANDDIVLWNPATNESKSIPSSGYPRIPGVLIFSTIGFGFDPKTNDYKILRMVYRDPPVVQMELYSLRKGSWKRVDTHHEFMVIGNVTPADVACSLPFTDNRIVCAVVSPINKANKWEILSFDMSSETYEIIPVSPSFDTELGEHKSFRYRKTFFKLFPFKETIAIGIVYRVGNGSYCDIWMLNHFDSSIQSRRCWSKYLSTNINDGYIVPVGCWGSSQILFEDKSSFGLLRLDHSNNMMVELGVFPPACVNTTVYKESLVRIDDTIGIEDEDSKCL